MSEEGPRDPRSDEELARAMASGEPEAFDALYRRYRDWVVRLAYRWTGTDDDALDVLQETFLYVFRKAPGFRLRARMTTFLFPVVRHLSAKARERRRRHAPGDGPLEAVPAAAGSREEAPEGLREVVDSLPAGQRDVLLLRYVDDLSLETIAEALEIPVGTVKSRLHHALVRLRASPRARRYFTGEPGRP